MQNCSTRNIVADIKTTCLLVCFNQCAGFLGVAVCYCTNQHQFEIRFWELRHWRRHNNIGCHITKVNFGSQFAGGIAMNKGRFDKLPPEVQKVFRDVGDEYSARFAAAQTAAAAGLLKKMEEAGAKISELPAAERKRWADTLPPIAKTWAADLQAKGLPADEVLKGYVEGLKKSGADLPRDWSAK